MPQSSNQLKSKHKFKEIIIMKLTYPAVFYKDEESEGYAVEVPDLPGCVSGGNNLAEAILMGVDAASGWILGEWEAGRTVNPASDIKDITPRPEDFAFISMLVLDMDSYAEKYGEKAVRKNLTIPAYLNTAAINAGINFSEILQEALERHLHLAV
jgi:predicted RNase H-like HicB family nuclease